ncbi:MAG: vtpJ-therm [Pseudohongiella sp.]|nr:MAG: vtpJ-therm [Pseudohongiella sp.]
MKVLTLALLLMLPFAVSAQTDLASADDLDEGWNTLETDGLCTAGTPFQFYAKTSDASDNLLVYFNGGGACWFGQACDLSSEPNIHSPFADMEANNPNVAAGIFDLENTDNPFSDYDIVFIPYCTGDVFVGSGEKTYNYRDAAGNEVSYTAHHNGYENAMTSLGWIYENFSAVDNIVVAGSSAGAIGASFYSGLIAEHYPSSPVVLLADAAGGYRTARLPVTLKAWDTAAILPDWEEYAGETNESLTFEDFYIASENHNPNLRLAQYNAIEDSVQKDFTHVIGDAPGSYSLPLRILSSYQEIESATDEFFSYTAGGEVHTILRADIFYDYKVEGTRFVDWVQDLIDGEAVVDISCVDDAAGCAEAPK